MVGELQAMEGAGRTVYDFPDAPWEFTMDMARQVWDESRHVEIYLRLLEHLDGYVGEFPETTILWRCACAEDAAARVAGVNRGLEGLACDVFNQLVHIARKIGRSRSSSARSTTCSPTRSPTCAWARSGSPS